MNIMTNYKNDLDNLLKKNKLNKDISYIENEFFQHMFLDNYIKDGNGNNPYNSCNIFIKLLDIYNINKKNIDIDNIINLLKISSDIILLNNDLYKNYQNRIINTLNDRNEVYISGGWMNINNSVGHSIGIYIKKNKNNIDIFIINSGLGIYHHGELISDLNGNIIIKYNYDDDEEYSITNKIIILIKKCLNTEKENSFDDNYKKLSFNLNDSFDNITDNENIDSIKSYHLSASRGAKYHFSARNIENLGESLLAYTNYTGCNFIKNKDFNSYDNYFYQTIKKILNNNNNTIELIDKIQFSGSCTYFSFYYFIKYKFNNNILFDEFITKSKDIIINLALNRNIKIYNSLLINSLYLINLNNDNILTLKNFINNNIINHKIINKYNNVKILDNNNNVLFIIL